MKNKILEAIIRKTAPVCPAKLTEELRLVEDLGYDSLSLMKLVSSIEDEYEDFSADEIFANEQLDVASVERALGRGND